MSLQKFNHDLRETFHDRTPTDLPAAARLNDALEQLGADACGECNVAYPDLCKVHASIVWRDR